LKKTSRLQTEEVNGKVIQEGQYEISRKKRSENAISSQRLILFALRYQDKGGSSKAVR
jgi:hypothetical protein